VHLSPGSLIIIHMSVVQTAERTVALDFFLVACGSIWQDDYH